MANVARRSFLKLIGVAPIAAPVAAQEAAAKMGLSGALALGETARHYGGEVAQCLPEDPGSHRKWLLKELAELDSRERRSEYRRQERHDARILDSDLASMRSVSPASAYSFQLDRCVDRQIEREKASIGRRLKQLVGL
jgi:hypothetical protein